MRCVNQKNSGRTLAALCTAGLLLALAEPCRAQGIKLEAFVPNLTSGSAILPEDAKVTALDIQLTAGSVQVQQGERYEIAVGSGLLEHAAYSLEDGTLFYADNLGETSLLEDWTDEAYTVRLTLPKEAPHYESVAVKSSVGRIALDDIQADELSVFTTGGGTLHLQNITGGSLTAQAQAGSLTLIDAQLEGALNARVTNGGLSLENTGAKSMTISCQNGVLGMKNATAAQNAEIAFGGVAALEALSAKTLTIASSASSTLRLFGAVVPGGLTLSLFDGSAEVTGEIGGSVTLRSGRAGKIKLFMNGARRGDYNISAKNLQVKTGGLRTGFSVDNRIYPYDYNDISIGQKYRLTIESDSKTGGDVQITFGG